MPTMTTATPPVTSGESIVNLLCLHLFILCIYLWAEWPIGKYFEL